MPPLYFRNFVTTGNIFEMFKTFEIRSRRYAIKRVFCCRQSEPHLDFPVWIDNFPRSFYLWEVCRYMTLICISFVLKGTCPYILWIWSFSILESVVCCWKTCDWSVDFRIYCLLFGGIVMLLFMGQSDIFQIL